MPNHKIEYIISSILGAMTEDSCILRESRPKYYGTLKSSPLKHHLSPNTSKCIEYIVQPEDTLASIAVRHDVNVNLLKRVNRRWNNDVIVSEILIVPVSNESSVPSTSSVKTTPRSPASSSSSSNNSKSRQNPLGISSPLNRRTSTPGYSSRQTTLDYLVNPEVATISDSSSSMLCHSPSRVDSQNGSKITSTQYFSHPDEIFQL